MLSYRSITAFLSLVFVTCCADVAPDALDDGPSSTDEESETGSESRDSGDDNTGDYNDDTTEDHNDDTGFDAPVTDAGIYAGCDAAVCSEVRWILADEIVNARDIGGTPLESGSTVACGLLFRGSMLTTLSQRGCKTFAQLGIRTVIDLRTASEVDSYSEMACIEESARIVRAPLPTPYSVSPQDYLTDLYTADSIARAFDVLGDPYAYPIYMNCVHGRDRTGIVIAVVLLTLGATPSVILKEYELTREAGLSAYPDSLLAVFHEIERIGGVESYLTEMGVTKDEIDTLRSQMTK